MKPPACVRNKWGSGTTCERPPESTAAKEVQSNYEKMLAERVKQDSQWFTKDDQTRPVSSPSNGPETKGK
jgi:hypothetical protein